MGFVYYMHNVTMVMVSPLAGFRLWKNTAHLVPGFPQVFLDYCTFTKMKDHWEQGLPPCHPLTIPGCLV